MANEVVDAEDEDVFVDECFMFDNSPDDPDDVTTEDLLERGRKSLKYDVAYYEKGLIKAKALLERFDREITDKVTGWVEDPDDQ